MIIIHNFVVFEGGDGTGTSTQLELLKKKLAQRAPELVFYPTFEPTDGPVGRLIRSALRRETEFLPETIARLFAADRNEHLFSPGGIVERCKRGELVVSDRYSLSSLVYQGIECGDALPRALNEGFPFPEMLIYFEIEADTALERLGNREVKDIYEYREFQVEAHRRYRELLPFFAAQGTRVETIDASKSIDELSEDIWSCLKNLPIMKA